MIQTLIDDYQHFISELQERLQTKQSYIEQHSSTAKTQSDIERQLSQIRLTIEQTKEKLQTNDLLKQVHHDLIPVHPLFPTYHIKQLHFSEENENWDRFLKSNHELVVEVRIQSIIPLIYSLDLNREIPFDTVRFSIHQAGQSAISDLFYYNVKYNLYRPRDLVDGKMLRGDRSLKLGLKHVIRPHLLELSKNLFKSHPLTLIAENANGLILGETIIDISQEFQENSLAKRCLNLKRLHIDSQQVTGEQNLTLSARIEMKIELNPIAPSLKDLKKNIRGRSNSPTRSVSKSPRGKGSPSKKKRELISSIIRSKQGPIQLAVIEGVQARWKIESSQGKRQIVYRQLKNIKERRVEFCRIGQEYFLKCYLVRQKRQQEGIFLFDFAEKQYSVQVVPDTLLTRINFDQYLRIKDKQLPQNRLVCLDQGLAFMLRENSRILKNFLKLNLIDEIPIPIFIKSPFQDCLITTYPPFYIIQSIRKEGGYAIQFYYSLSKKIEYNEQKVATFFLTSEGKIPKQTHLYDCIISPRVPDRQTLYRELIVSRNENFCSLQMKGISLDSIYNIRSTSPALSVVNGSSYRLLEGPLVLQIQNHQIIDNQIDLIARDEKKRCLVIRLRMINQDVQE